MNLKKNKKWLKLMEADFLETVHWNLLKLLEHVTIIYMHRSIKQICKWMH
jgi:hypothetical protein